MRYKESLLLPFFGAIIAVSPLAAQEKTMLKIGGALRFNYNYSDWKPENRKRGGEFDFDVFRLNVNASYKKFDLAADYRFYPASSGGGMLREGWIGYSFNKSHRLQMGLTTVPFRHPALYRQQLFFQSELLCRSRGRCGHGDKIPFP